jgi:hypothetical protein
MNRLIFAALALAALAAPARAAPVDMNTWTCQDWLDADEDEQEQAIGWLRGYLSSKSGASLFDFATVRSDSAIRTPASLARRVNWAIDRSVMTGM